MRADMFTVCSVFYELSPSFSAPPRPPLQWCNGGGRWEPEKWDDVLLLTNSLTNVVLLPFSCTPPHSDFTSAKVHWDTLLQHLPVSRLPAASQTSVLSSLFRLNRCLCPPSSAVINYFTYFQGSKQMPTCTELRKKKTLTDQTSRFKSNMESRVFNWYSVLCKVRVRVRVLWWPLYACICTMQHKNTTKIRWHNLFCQADPGVIYPNHTSVSFRQLQRSSTQTAAIFSNTQMFTHSLGYALLRGVTFNQLHCWFSPYSPAHAVRGDLSGSLLAVQRGGR